jgi:hypothetical protein
MIIRVILLVIGLYTLYNVINIIYSTYEANTKSSSSNNDSYIYIMVWGILALIPITINLLVSYYTLNAAYDYNVDNKNFIIEILKNWNLI